MVYTVHETCTHQIDNYKLNKYENSSEWLVGQYWHSDNFDLKHFKYGLDILRLNIDLQYFFFFLLSFVRFVFV